MRDPSHPALTATQPASAFDPTPGVCETVADGVRRILAPNPSAMTFRGTNTYIVGHGEVALIDPGPMHRGHADAVLAALAGERISHIFVTHAHLDHSALAHHLHRELAIPVLAFGTAQTGRRPIMQALERDGQIGGGEGVDAAFAPTHTLPDRARVAGSGWSIEALHTPGHMSNHMCFAFDEIVFTGDHVMGWSTSMISPPDGDAAAFRASCERLLARPETVYLPGHGPTITDGPARVRALLDHRAAREAQILAALADGGQDVATLTARLYAGLAPQLRTPASRNVLAHLIDLAERNRVLADSTPHPHTRFSLNENF